MHLQVASLLSDAITARRHGEETRTVFIYGLLDPRDNSLRYVGKADDAQLRYRVHLARARRENSTHKDSWILRVLGLGALPILVHLARVPREDWQWYERLAIKSAISLGCRLTNSTSGGDGVTDPSAASIEKGNIKRRETASRPEHKKKMSTVLKEALARPEVKERMSASFKESRSKPEVKEAMRARGKLQWSAPELRAQRSKEIADKWRDPDYRAQRIAAYKKVWSEASPEFRNRQSEIRKEIWRARKEKAGQLATQK